MSTDQFLDLIREKALTLVVLVIGHNEIVCRM
jgi:hypothetical protein